MGETLQIRQSIRWVLLKDHLGKAMALINVDTREWFLAGS